MKLDSHFTLHKSQLRMDEGLNLRPKAVQFLEETVE